MMSLILASYCTRYNANRKRLDLLSGSVAATNYSTVIFLAPMTDTTSQHSTRVDPPFQSNWSDLQL